MSKQDRFVIVLLIVLILGLVFFIVDSKAQAWRGRDGYFVQEPFYCYDGPYNRDNCDHYGRGWNRDYYYQRGPTPYGYPYYPEQGYYQWQRRQESNRSPYENLQIIPAGQVTVTTDPVDANVLVDGYPLHKEGNTAQISMHTGIHQFDVIASGYKKHTEQVQVLAGKNILLEISLEKE